MALIFDHVQPVPQTHIFIIGIGAYPFLLNGSQSKPQVFDGIEQLDQLSSPPVSAEAFYNLALAMNKPPHGWTKPLGSIEVLASVAPDAQPVFAGLNTEPATMENIRKAYRSWKNRCNSSEENVAIFFYCGHGLEKSDQFLLAEDFGQDPDNPWTECFNFDDTRLAFHACKAKTQLFFVDSCRQLTAELLTYDIKVGGIEPPSFTGKVTEYDLTMKAAAPNEKAYGKKNEVSFFTQALITGLKGDAAEPTTRGWTVQTGGLSKDINSLIASVAPTENYKQRCISTLLKTIDVIMLPGAPNVVLNLSCDPDHATPLADLYCKNLNTNDIKSRPPEADPWEITVEAGVYQLDAKFQQGQFNPPPVFEHLKPPSFTRKIPC